MRRVSSAVQVLEMTSSRGSARFIGPKATSSKTVAATCESWVDGFWKPMPMRWLTWCIGQASRSCPFNVMRPRIRPPMVRGASPLATRQSVVFPDSEAPASPTTTPSAQVKVDIQERRTARARVPVADSGERERHGAKPATRAATSSANPSTSAQRSAVCHALSGGDQSSVRRPGRVKPRASRAIVRSSTSAIEPRMTGPTIGTTPRARFQNDPSVSSPRARCAAVICAARSTIAGTVWTDAFATNADSRADAAPLEVDHQVGRPGGQVEERDSAADGQDPDQDLERESQALAGRRERADAEQDLGATGEEEQVDQEGRDGDRQRQEQAQPQQLTHDARHEGRDDDAESHEQDRPDEPAKDHRGYRRNQRQRRLRQRVQAMEGTGPWAPDDVGDAPARDVAGAQAVAPRHSPSSPVSTSPVSTSRSPCGKRASVRRAMAARMM